MAHEIFGDRFYSLRKPAWHQLGIVAEDEAGAVEVLEMLGEPAVTLEPISIRVPGGGMVELKQRAIVRHPTDDDPEYVAFGIVGPEYHLLNPRDVCVIWDEYVAQPVETAGFLRRGSTFFLTSRLPAIGVRGDELEMYLGAAAPIDGEHAATCEIWPLRVVCANTLRAAQENARAVYTVRHDRSARLRMGEWLADMYRQAEQSTAVLKAAFEILAATRVNGSGQKLILEAAYPLPKPPRENAPAEVMEQRKEDHLEACDRALFYRERAAALFAGAGTGMNLPATKGTAWGLYNAVVETEDYRRGFGTGHEEARRVAESTLFGARAETKVRAYEAAMAYAGR